MKIQIDPIMSFEDLGEVLEFSYWELLEFCLPLFRYFTIFSSFGSFRLGVLLFVRCLQVCKFSKKTLMMAVIWKMFLLWFYWTFSLGQRKRLWILRLFWWFVSLILKRKLQGLAEQNVPKISKDGIHLFKQLARKQRQYEYMRIESTNNSCGF